MPMHEKARIRSFERLAKCKPEHVDFWLDDYNDGRLRATEWDAGQWGLPYAHESVPGFPDDGMDYKFKEPSKHDL